VAEPSPPDVVFEGNSLNIIRDFPKDVRENFGGDLRRLQNGERPLDSGSMAPALPGVF
jgi:phage-related protein